MLEATLLGALSHRRRVHLLVGLVAADADRGRLLPTAILVGEQGDLLGSRALLRLVITQLVAVDERIRMPPRHAHLRLWQRTRLLLSVMGWLLAAETRTL